MSEQITPNPSVPSQVVQEVKFPKFVNNLGIIPTSYKDSMSYYECLAWLCKYLEETVIPTLNQNGSAVQELQELYVELNNYVAHYFDNLDVQEEINNKLDDLVEDGTMAEIINQEIFGELNQRIATLENNNNRKIIVIGDSYGIQQFDASPILKFFWEIIAENLSLTENVNIFEACRSGASFTNGNFLGRLQQVSANISNKETITDIFIVGGYNDSYSNITVNNILTGMTNLNNYVKANYINARVSVAHVGYDNPYILDNSWNVSTDRILKSIDTYKKGSALLGWRYISGAEYILHNYDSTYWQADGVHPSQLGQNELGQYLTEGFLNGYVNIYRKSADTGVELSASGIATAIGRNKVLWYMDNDSVNIDSQLDQGFVFTIADDTSISCNGFSTYEIATVNCPYLYGWNCRNSITVPMEVFDTSNEKYTGIAVLQFYKGKLKFEPLILGATPTQNLSISPKYVYFNSLHAQFKTRYS